MNKNTKWLLAVGVATMVTANGLAMAAVTSEKQDIPSGKSHIADKGDFARKGGMKSFRGDHTALLEFLKIDAETLKSDMGAGKTLITIAQEHGVSEQSLKDFMVGQMTQRIDEGLKAGRIQADKAEKMKANMDKNVSDMINGKGPMGHGRMHGPKMFNDAKLLDLLKVDAQTLKNDMQAGKSLATVAQEHGVSEQSLKDFMVGQMTQHIDEDLKAGRIPADKAEKMKTNMDKNVSDMINGKGPMGHGPMHGPKMFDDAKLLDLLKTDAQTLKTDMQAGKSLVAIAQEHGVSEQSLKDFMVGQMTQHIDEGLKAGRIPADKAEKMKTDMEQRVSDMINGKGPMHGHKERNKA